MSNMLKFIARREARHVALFLLLSSLLLACGDDDITTRRDGGGGTDTATTDTTDGVDERGDVLCFDGVDNDRDGATDCDDDGCTDACEAPPELCGDGVDNDRDGQTDCDDADCACGATEICDDSIDNDADGRVDCEDSDCDCPDPEVCGDGVDNDGDGLADCDDPDCDCPPMVDPRMCEFASGGGRMLLDTQDGFAGPLSFTVTDVPDPALISSAILAFDGFDLDHPNEEGWIRVNGTRYPLPADSANDNRMSSERVTITTGLRAGTNTIEFERFSAARAYYAIENVRLLINARVADCDETGPVDPPPTGGPRDRMRIPYESASYTMRARWVVGCPGSHWRYAWTASAAEHIERDCDGIYRPSSYAERRGDAIFRFTGVASGRWRVLAGARHTSSRSPNALFIVQSSSGTEMREVDQRGGGEYADDTVGEFTFAGDVTVTLRARGDSVAITHVTLEPI